MTVPKVPLISSNDVVPLWTGSPLLLNKVKEQGCFSLVFSAGISIGKKTQKNIKNC